MTELELCLLRSARWGKPQSQHFTQHTEVTPPPTSPPGEARRAARGLLWFQGANTQARSVRMLPKSNTILKRGRPENVASSVSAKTFWSRKPKPKHSLSKGTGMHFIKCVWTGDIWAYQRKYTNSRMASQQGQGALLTATNTAPWVSFITQQSGREPVQQTRKWWRQGPTLTFLWVNVTKYIRKSTRIRI